MNPLDQDWQVIVIGAGMGGGIAARALAEAGLRVLVLEQGRAGHRREETPIDSGLADPVARAVRGLWPTPLQARLGAAEIETFAPLGAGVGGSSVFYAATLERPSRHDIDDLPERPHPAGGWPVSHAELAPWLDRAEAMLEVAGEPDPLAESSGAALRPPAPPGPVDEAVRARLERNGLHPYRLHAAIRHLPGCRACLGRKCPRACKMDGRSAGIEPALATGNAALVTGCEVTALIGEGRVEALEVRHEGQRRRISAPHVVLAAGALGSARLLLASAQEGQPQGFANASGLVGRGLMFHLNEMIAVWPPGAAGGPSKALGFRDLAWHEGERLGMVQAMGIEAGFGEILHHLRLGLARRTWLARLPGVDPALGLAAGWAEKLLGRAQVFVGLLEDLPYEHNRVLLAPEAPGGMRIEYDFAPELLARRQLFRRAMRRAFRGWPRMFLGHGPEPNLGHPSGTLRMGHAPGTSVVDSFGRAHEAPNLHVADASVFAGSMGVNPSLTIAALALRMADRLVKDMREASP